MAHPKDHLSPERLIEAAEAAFRAAREVSPDHGGVMPYPADLLGARDQPDYLAEFTRWEIEQASEFLVRQTPDKSDLTDAQLLADLTRVGYLPRVWIAPEPIRELNVADFTCFLQKYAAGCP